MKKPPPGYALFEMVAAISLLAVFLIVSSRLITQVAATQRDAARTEWATSRMDFALRELRKDIWSAASVAVVDDETLTLRDADGAERTWAFASEPSNSFPQRGWLTRQAVTDPDASTFDQALPFEVPRAIRFADGDAPGLTVVVDHHKLWMASQVMVGRDAGVGEVTP